MVLRTRFRGYLTFFLHNIYFQRLLWARLTLKPSKSQLIEPLGMLVGRHTASGNEESGKEETGQAVGKAVVSVMRVNNKKRGKVDSFPVPKCEKDM